MPKVSTDAILFLINFLQKRSVKVFILFLFFTVAFFSWYLIYINYLNRDVIFQFFLTHKKTAPIFFVIVHMFAAAFFIPCSPLTIFAGFLWGQTYGIVLSMAGALSGSSLTFLLARYFASDYIKRNMDNSLINMMTKNVDLYGWKIIAFTQINPVFPSSTLGYVYGLTSISFKLYILTMIIFMLPLSFALVSLGTSFREILFFSDRRYFLLPLTIMVLSFFCLFLLKPLTKKFINRSEMK